MSKVSELTAQLTRSLRRPTSRSLRLLDRALSYLSPCESPNATVTSPAERQDLLTRLNIHRDLPTPYLDNDRIESNLSKA